METHIGLKIRALRREKNLSQQQLADAIGVTSGQISAIESGKSEGSKATIKNIAEYFKLELQELKSDSNQNYNLSIKDKLVDELKSQLEYFKDLLRLESEKNVRLTKTLENISSNFREGSERNARANGFTILAAA
ncbi:MAG: helix-turn-helix transcriptional regulator [Cytophagales bacterium]